ncbi:aldose epimerase family protein [Mongoliitalea daihaiensis]|uniref:aldose epimerase family protein n=1 Tax=Mongoliitalea daihaiensis TaxID=2782006 RepID=UPI001F32E2E9|nr:aldose epimerase family protein [Mongoliitalea daihaiensis]UJP66917.1 galactose mutarotase [Mongoliitalea daihaiensis]
MLTIEQKLFGKLPNGQDVTLFTMNFKDEVIASVMDYGATWTHFFGKDRDGKLADVVLGFDTLEGYLQEDYQNNYCYIGSTVGRIAGRIKGNQFSLDGQTFHLPLNAGAIHLHGGIEGWDRKLWKATLISETNQVGVRFYYQSPHGEEGYPGTVDVWVTYTLNTSGELSIHYKAITDKKTIINPTNHAYFNLSGDFRQPITDHMFTVDADSYLPVDSQGMPTGAIVEVAESPFDFRTPILLEEQLGKAEEQLQLVGGIDHSFVLNNSEYAATLFHPLSGRKLIVHTLEPGLQVYTGNSLGNDFLGKGGVTYGKYSAICLETQHFPDAINQPAFQSVVVEPGEGFESKTVFVLTS